MEDIAVDPFLTSSFGTFMMALFQGSLTVPSWQSFTYLAYGWAWTYGRQTITAYLWVSGATSVKHFSRYYAFLGGSLYTARYTLWARVIRGGAALAPPAAVISLSIDDTTMKKSGPHIAGGDYYRNGAGTARQEYRSLWGINLVWAIMHVPLQRWPGHHLSLPIGLELYLKAKLAGTLGVPYRSRSQLARCIVDLAAQHLPDRTIRVVADGEYATKAFLRHLPKQVHVICRFLSTAKLYQVPLTPAKKRRGAPRKKGDLIGSPKTLAQQPAGWQPHPQEAGALVQSWVGLWHSVLPGRPIRLVVVRRPSHEGTQGPKGKKPFGRLKPLEAFLSTEVSCRPADMLAASQERWAVEIDIRDGHAFYGVAQDQCRKLTHIIGANTFRLLMAAARTLWFIDHSERAGGVALCRLRPWYRQKVAPSQMDIAEACREVLHEEGIFPIPRFFPTLGKNQPGPDKQRPIAA
jgi:hypothetical protein